MEERTDRKNSNNVRFADHYFKSKSARTRRTSENGKTYYMKYKEGQKKYRFTRKEFANVRRILNEELLNTILEGEVIHLPYKLGYLYILRVMPKITAFGTIIAPVDFAKTMELGHNVYIDNTEYDGYSFKAKWFKKRRDHNSMFFFSFKLTKFGREKLKEKLKIRNFYKRYRNVPVYRC